MKKLRISSGLALPPDTVTSTLVVYGGKGMGKTNFLAVLAEELAAQHLRFSVMDPVGGSWGLQHGRAGEPGLPVLILGGAHGDIPIEPTAGVVVADLVADEAVSTVVDISRRANGKMWSKGEKIRFVADYMTRLYERQGEKRIPLMQILDEAGRYCPQTIPHSAVDLARCVGAIEELVELGRNVAVGVTLVTQRSARMNKSVSELADCMVAFRTVGPNSVGAITDWLGEHVDRPRHKDLTGQLRQLPVGTALVVSPGWLEFEGVVAIRERTTFDSSKTPRPGARAVRPGKAAKPDLKKYEARMAETVEKAKLEDPKALRAELAKRDQRIAVLERAATRHPPVAPPERVEVPMFDRDAFDELGRRIREHQMLESNNIKGALHVYMSKCLERAKAKPGSTIGDGRPASWKRPPRPMPAPKASQAKAKPPQPVPKAGDLSVGRHAVLRALAQHGLCERGQLRTLTGYRTSTMNRLLGELSALGFAERSGKSFSPTKEGIAVLGVEYEPLPTGSALLARWLGKLGEGQRKMLEVLAAAYPAELWRTDLSTRTGYAVSTRNRLIGELRAMRVCTTNGDMVRMSEELSDG